MELPNIPNYHVPGTSPLEMLQQSAQYSGMVGQMTRQNALQGAQQSLAQNPTHDNIVKTITQFPELYEGLKPALDMQESRAKDEDLRTGIRIYSAMQNGRDDIAIQIAEEKAKAYRNSGRDDDAMGEENLAKMIRENPGQARQMSALVLAASMGIEKFTENFGKLAEAQGELGASPYKAQEAQYKAISAAQDAQYKPLEMAGKIAKTDAEIRNIEAQAVGREAQNADGIALTADARKLVNDATAASVQKGRNATNMLSLAEKYESDPPSAGWGGGAAEWMKKATGREDAYSEMKREFARIKNQKVIDLLPPGPASDRDIQIMMAGFPPNNANATVVASFLRGIAKASRYESAIEELKSDWVSQNGNLGRARRDLDVYGKQVGRGASFNDFLKSNIEGVINEKDNDRAKSVIKTRSYSRVLNGGANGN